jgi:hypothetical protein
LIKTDSHGAIGSQSIARHDFPAKRISPPVIHSRPRHRSRSIKIKLS